MTPRERIEATCNHQEPDRVAVDFGGGFQTGIHASVVYALRQHYGLDAPDTPVKVVETYQMLGEVKDDLYNALGIDTVSLHGTGSMFGYPSADFKEWKFHDGTPLLVPEGFNTEYDASGDLFQYPENDRSLEPSAKMPEGGYFFDAIVRQNHFDEDRLNPADNLEEFSPIATDELAIYSERANTLYDETDRALFCTFGGLTFGDVALVPAPFLKDPKGIRDIEEWYISLIMRPDYIKAVFEEQAEIAVQNLARLHAAVGDKISVIQTNGTDFGTQNGPFCSPDQYRDLFLPYQQKVNGWIHENTNWKTFMHCCGSIVPLLDLIVEAGFDILNPVQYSAAGMDSVMLKKLYGDQLTFWGGGIDTQKVLPFGTPAEVETEVSRQIETFAPGGGFVFCSVHNVQACTPTENMVTLFQTLKKDYS
ncbi:MAG: methyltransferase [Verrucomicrobia bacterium]|nr:MAG: methyltransferase [Verrucomicrobiota bacterium]